MWLERDLVVAEAHRLARSFRNAAVLSEYVVFQKPAVTESTAAAVSGRWIHRARCGLKHGHSGIGRARGLEAGQHGAVVLHELEKRHRLARHALDVRRADHGVGQDRGQCEDLPARSHSQPASGSVHEEQRSRTRQSTVTRPEHRAVH